MGPMHQQEESFDPPDSSKTSSLWPSNGVPQTSNYVAWPAECFTPRFQTILFKLFRSNSTRRLPSLLGGCSESMGERGWTGMKPEVGQTFVLPQ